MGSHIRFNQTVDGKLSVTTHVNTEAGLRQASASVDISPDSKFGTASDFRNATLALFLSVDSRRAKASKGKMGVSV